MNNALISAARAGLRAPVVRAHSEQARRDSSAVRDSPERSAEAAAESAGRCRVGKAAHPAAARAVGESVACFSSLLKPRALWSAAFSRLERAGCNCKVLARGWLYDDGTIRIPKHVWPSACSNSRTNIDRSRFNRIIPCR